MRSVKKRTSREQNQTRLVFTEAQPNLDDTNETKEESPVMSVFFLTLIQIRTALAFSIKKSNISHHDVK